MEGKVGGLRLKWPGWSHTPACLSLSPACHLEDMLESAEKPARGDGGR